MVCVCPVEWVTSCDQSVAFQAFVQFMVLGLLGLKPSKKPHLLLDLRPDVDRPKVKKQITKFGIFIFANNILSNLFQLSFLAVHRQLNR